jgi:hypothetical protein
VIDVTCRANDHGRGSRITDAAPQVA